MLDQAWVGVDVGKDHHWAAAVDADGRVLLSRKVPNDQQAILGVLVEVQALATRLTWTVDLTTAEAALLLAVLWGHRQQVRYLAGQAVHQAAVGYRGEAKTDAKDARIIADQSRMRRDLPELQPGQDLIVELRILTSRRADLVADRTRAINRLRQQLTAICPALEHAAVLAGQRGWVVLVAHYQRPGDLRSLGVAPLAALLAGHGIRNADRIASPPPSSRRRKPNSLSSSSAREPRHYHHSDKRQFPRSANDEWQPAPRLRINRALLGAVGGHVWSTSHRNRAVSSGHQRYVVSRRSHVRSWGTSPGAEP